MLAAICRQHIHTQVSGYVSPRAVEAVATAVDLGFTPRAWMSLIIRFGQMLKVQSGVDLRRRDVGVTQHLLHRSQVLRGLQNVAGEAMAQHVRMYMCGQASRLREFRELCLDNTRRDAPASCSDEQGIGVGISSARRCQLGSDFDPALYRRQCGLSDGDAAAFAAFAQYKDFGLGEVEPTRRFVGGGTGVVQIEPHEFRQPQAAGIQEFEHGAIA